MKKLKVTLPEEFNSLYVELLRKNCEESKGIAYWDKDGSCASPNNIAIVFECELEGFNKVKKLNRLPFTWRVNRKHVVFLEDIARESFVKKLLKKFSWSTND